MRPPASAALVRSWPPAPRAEDLAILRTVVYASLFQFPLSLPELERRLVDRPLDLASIRKRLVAPFLGQRLALTDGFVHPRGREAWIGLRREREARTEALLREHRRALLALARFPFVRLLALSGGCAHGNATDDDVDVFLVVKRGRAWVVFGALLVLSKLAGLRRTLCINYVVDEDAQSLPDHDRFTAAEIVGMKPLAGALGYARFLAENAWIQERFPNFARAGAAPPGLGRAGASRPWEALLEMGVAPLFERLSRRVLGAYLKAKGRGGEGVVLEPGRLKLHLRDHRAELLAAYDAALEEAER
jgi:hypothetical protein